MKYWRMFLQESEFICSSTNAALAPKLARRGQELQQVIDGADGGNSWLCQESLCCLAGSLCQRTIGISLLHNSENICIISFPLDGCMDTFQAYLLQSIHPTSPFIIPPSDAFSSTTSLTDVFLEASLQKHSPQWELGLSWVPSKWMFLGSCGHNRALAVRQWY